MKKILILGGTGFVGRHVCEKLTQLQWRVTVPTRHEANARDIQMLPALDVVQANVHDEAALTRLVAGHDAVVNLIAILHGTQEAFQRTHVQLPQKLARACAATGVQRLVHVSALGADMRNPDVAPSMYLRSKGHGEVALHAAALELTVLRPSVMFGADDKFLNTFARLQKIFPVIPLAASHALFQPVWVEDVASAIVHCLQDAHTHATVDQTFEACGPGIFTLRQLVELAGRMSGINEGRGRPVIPLPAALGRLQARLMELAPGEPLMSRDNLDSMTLPNIASGNLPGLEALGITPAALEAVAPTYLGPLSGGWGLRSHLTLKRKTAGRF
ncbi:MAG: complex I NDUFA9 subunit family protein [Polaromonas sp.]|uniref:complex I NDUFA9 subunit family protein n=1 Tax=Polaromonas sp. TaxID=1869339 RepID=UPI0027312BCE|nr:complex I NDUFA9 subunit family protein [Polaromonas sp.]MDP2449300.1 complex I NDUFA9 subunit family protein [Polaromonas sp.]MDP3245505.1 complex I NDUFA9 subunit family protein [Polaromonas sp.]MDP3754683.1 complex I NDUFA9 subunit family protein [Polaromonas sp.]